MEKIFTISKSNSNMKKLDSLEIIFIIIAIIFYFVGFLFLEEIFSKEIDEFSKAIFSAVIGSIFTVAAMTVVIKLQTRQDRDKEFMTKLFEQKLTIYKEFLDLLFRADDDNILEDKEIQDIENKVGDIALVASADLMSCMTQFMLQLKIYGCIYPRSMSDKQIEHFLDYFSNNSGLSKNKNKKNLEITKSNFNDLFVTIDDVVQGIRTDLDMVKGPIKDDISLFVSIRLDKYKMIRNPNIID